MFSFPLQGVYRKPFLKFNMHAGSDSTVQLSKLFWYAGEFALTDTDALQISNSIYKKNLREGGIDDVHIQCSYKNISPINIMLIVMYNLKLARRTLYWY